MRDGRTRKLERPTEQTRASQFFAVFKVTLVIVEGPSAGTEFEIDRESVVLGRGPDVDLCFDDTAMSREHATLELTGDGFRLRDLASSNGVTVNGASTLVCDLKHSDRFQLGEHVFQYVLEEIQRSPRSYQLPDD